MKFSQAFSTGNASLHNSGPMNIWLNTYKKGPPAQQRLPLIYHSRPCTVLSPRSSCSTPCQYLGAKSDVLKVGRGAHASLLKKKKKSTVSSRECINLVVHTSEGWLYLTVRSLCSDSAPSTKQTIRHCSGCKLH